MLKLEAHYENNLISFSRRLGLDFPHHFAETVRSTEKTDEDWWHSELNPKPKQPSRSQTADPKHCTRQPVPECSPDFVDSNRKPCRA